MATTKTDWRPIIEAAVDIVHEAAPLPITLRGFYYRLLGRHGYANTEYHCKYLSRVTAEARRQGRFPPLAEDVRGIEQGPVGGPVRPKPSGRWPRSTAGTGPRAKR